MTAIPPDTPVEVRDLPHRSMLVLYGTETGNSQDIAEELGRAAQRLHFRTKVEEMNAVSLSELLRQTLLVCVISTTGQGDFPQNSLSFWKGLLRKKLPPSCLATVKFTTFGLGDSSYPKFNWAARKLHKRLEQLGASEFYPRGEGDEQDDDGIDQTYIRWSIDLRSKLLERFPLPEGVAPIPSEALLPPRYKLLINDCPNSSVGSKPNGWNLWAEGRLLGQPGAVDGRNFQRDGPQTSSLTTPNFPEELVYSVPDPVVTVLKQNERLTPTDHWQDVRRISFDVHKIPKVSLDIYPGDCLKLYPRNFAQDADRLIELMEWQRVADVALDMEAMGELPTGLYTPRYTTLHRLLTDNLDITAVPRRSFLEAISHHCTDEYHKARLIEFTQSEYIDEYYDYATRSRRSIIEVLEEFHSVKIPLEYVLDVFPIIRGRDFSIASIHRHTNTTPSSSTSTTVQDSSLSSPSPTSAATAAYTVDLLVALVKYKTVLRKIRTGLCSRYLTPLAPGTPLLATHKPTLSTLHGPQHAGRPLCAMATGTGVGPVHALIQERLSYDRGPGPDAHSTGRALLFFGNRSRDKDFFFKHEWAAIPNDKLRVLTAFSRDQRRKVYIQDVIRENAAAVTSLARENAIFVVCGGSSKMATACREAVTACLVEGGLCGSENEAREYFYKLTWWQEIW